MLAELPKPVQTRFSISQQQIDDFCRHWKLARLSLFGSVLRDDFGPDSDIDLLYLFLPDHGWSAFDWLDMKAELEKLLGRKVDLTSQKYLKNPYLIKEISNTEQVLYERAGETCPATGLRISVNFGPGNGQDTPQLSLLPAIDR